MPNNFFEDTPTRAKQRRHMTDLDLWIGAIGCFSGLLGVAFGLYVAFFYKDKLGHEAPVYIAVMAIVALLAVLAACYFTYRRDRLFAFIGLFLAILTPSGYAAYFSIFATLAGIYLLIRLLFYDDKTFKRR